jgi:hypothetical protein
VRTQAAAISQSSFGCIKLHNASKKFYGSNDQDELNTTTLTLQFTRASALWLFSLLR